MKKIVIFGTGAFAEVAYYYLKNDSEYEIVGFSANKKFISQDNFCGLPVIPFEEIEKKFPPKEYDMFIAIVYTDVNKIREQIYNKAKTKGYNLINYVNSKAIIWDGIKMGDNCFILENVVIQPFVTIGNNVIIWSGNHIGHHSKIDDHCFITSHVVISGNVEIGSNCFLGVNSTIRDGITIAPECVIGAGSVILKDTKQKQVFSTNSTFLLSKSSDELTKL
jgi:sugar O-acyltransferase (sialic acid O-acetyltransferase NeuD family)